MSDTYLSSIQTEIASRLNADSYFTDIIVLSEQKKDLANEIDRSLGTIAGKGGKVGACVIVMSPVGTAKSANLSRPILDLDISVRVLENVTVNSATGGTGKKALDIANRVLKALYAFSSVGLIKLLRAKTPTITPVDDPFAEVAYDVQFETTEADPDNVDKCATVIITFASRPGALTLQSRTSGASIYYTVDGSYPSSVNEDAVLYNDSSKPTITEACTVKAVAYKTGYVGSNVSSLTIS